MIALIAGLFFVFGAVTVTATEYEIKFGSIAPENTPWADGVAALKKNVETQSKGKIKMKVFLGGALGGEVEMVRSLRRGRIQAYGGTAASVAEGVGIPELQLLELPYLFDNLEEVDYILDKVVFDDYQKILNEKGFYLDHWHENGWRNFATHGVEVHTPEDLRKLKMRSQESKVHLAMYKALRVQAESIPVPEVLGALKTGMVNGFDNTPLFTSASGWYEGIDHYIISQHIYQPGLILYSLDFINSLPEDLRKILLSNPEERVLSGRAGVREMSEPLLQNFRETGIKVYELTPAEKEVFKEQLLPVHQEFSPIAKALLEKIYAGKKAFAEMNRKQHEMNSEKAEGNEL
jgi:TRAP-type C4-dicarboxylate transport system substrate-binding protein